MKKATFRSSPLLMTLIFALSVTTFLLYKLLQSMNKNFFDYRSTLSSITKRHHDIMLHEEETLNNEKIMKMTYQPMDINVYFDTEYLPNLISERDQQKNSLLDDENSTTLPSWSEDSYKLWNAFDETQQSSCSQRRYISVPNYGVASSILHVINLSWRYWLNGHAVILHPKNKWKWENQKWPSIMKPLNETCPSSFIEKKISKMEDDFVGERWDQPTVNKTTFLDTWDPDSIKQDHYGNEFRRKYGDLIFASAATAYFLSDKMLKIGTQNCIGMHIRRGDSCGRKDGYQQKGYSRKCPPFETYFDASSKLREKYGWSEVFVATDYHNITAIEEVAKTYNFTIRTQKMDRSIYNSNSLIDYRLDSIMKLEDGEDKLRQATNEVYYDLKILSSCRGYIGSLHSTMDQLALQLLVYRHGSIPPFISVDDPWCPTFGGNNFCPSFKRSCKCVEMNDII